MSEKTYFRPSWDDYFMSLARIIAMRSTCDRLRAGAVLTKDRRVISTGYNGSPPGFPHCDGREGHLMEEGHCVRTIHAEHNAILQTAVTPSQSAEGATLYTLYSPCIHCAKYIAAVGIKRVVIGKIYRANQAVEYLSAAGIEVNFYQENNEWYKTVRELFTDQIETKDNVPKVTLNSEKT